LLKNNTVCSAHQRQSAWRHPFEKRYCPKGKGTEAVGTVAVAMVCKTPTAGQSKTRLSPPLSPDKCARLSACFISDVASTIQSLASSDDVIGYAVYAPEGSEAAMRLLLPDGFRLLAQRGSGLGERLTAATADLLAAGHAGVILVNADGPTLPRSILRAAVEAVRGGDRVVLSPALDGGYTLIGLSKPHPEIFAGIPWSTATVYRVTVDRAREVALSVTNVPGWYDVDDLASLRILEAELGGQPPDCAVHGVIGGDAPATRRFLAEHGTALASAAR
jgi:rSAM/selenodomain-associated transferase 1